MQRDLDDLLKWADRVKLFGTRESYRVRKFIRKYKETGGGEEKKKEQSNL